MREAIVKQLHALSEPDYGRFNQRIITDTHYPILGVRVPALRRLAKSVSSNCRELLQQARFETYEETLIAGLAVAYSCRTFSDKEGDLRYLLPHLDSWGMTDTIVPTLKVKPEERVAVWDFAGECLSSDLEYTRRFGIIIMMNYFLDADHLPEVVARILELHDSRYYVCMASA